MDSHVTLYWSNLLWCITICYIYINPGKAGFCIFNYYAVLWCSQIIKYIMAWCPDTKVHGANMGPTGPRWAPCGPREPCCLGGHIQLFAHHATSLSLLCRPIWRYWTAKMLVRYILSRVCLRLDQFSQLSFMQYKGLRVCSLPISLMMIVRIAVLDLTVIIKSEVWPICHCLG